MGKQNIHTHTYKQSYTYIYGRSETWVVLYTHMLFYLCTVPRLRATMLMHICAVSFDSKIETPNIPVVYGLFPDRYRRPRYLRGCIHKCNFGNKSDLLHSSSCMACHGVHMRCVYAMVFSRSKQCSPFQRFICAETSIARNAMIFDTAPTGVAESTLTG